MSVLMAYITVTKSASTLLAHTHAAATWDIYYTIMEPLAMVKPVLNKISKRIIFSIPCTAFWNTLPGTITFEPSLFLQSI